MKREFDNGIVLEEVDTGLLVRQWDDAYLAKRWRLSESVIELVECSIQSGLRWMIRERHPQHSRRWPSQTGTVYLAFSPTREGQWSLAIDTFRPASGEFGSGVFNGKYQYQFDESGLPYIFEKRNKTAGHLVVAKPDVISTVRALSGFNHHVLDLGREAQGDGFHTEYDIQRSLIANWNRLDFGSQFSIVGDEVPLDQGMTPRRIDILAKHHSAPLYWVIELKRGEAPPSALEQVCGYVSSVCESARFGGIGAQGIIIAERIGVQLQSAAEQRDVVCYEIAWPYKLTRVC